MNALSQVTTGPQSSLMLASEGHTMNNRSSQIPLTAQQSQTGATTLMFSEPRINHQAASPSMTLDLREQIT